MSKYRARAVAVLIALTLGVTAAAFQAPRTPAPRLAPPSNGTANVSIKVAQMTTPVKGQAYQFSLCAGQPLAAGVASTVCHAADATGVNGASGNSIVSFKLQNGSFLPKGLHLDGNGVITGTTTADLSNVTVKICAFQIGGMDSNFNCQGQTLGFNGGKVVVLNKQPAPAPAAPAAEAGSSGPGLGAALALGAAGAAGYGTYKYLESSQSPDLGCVTADKALEIARACGSNPNSAACQQVFAVDDKCCRDAGKKGYSIDTGACY